MTSRPGNGVASTARKRREPSPFLEAFIPIERPSRPAQLKAVYKWMVVVCVTIFTVYFFEAREHDLLAWAMSFRAVLYSLAVFTMIGSFAFPLLRLGVFGLLVIYVAVLGWVIAANPSLLELRELMNITASNPLNETAYDTGCELYDSSHPQPFHNFLDKMDIFVWLHVIGYIFKFLFLRSWWMCTAVSISFELAEYSLEHHLPNFKECWWDHWIVDFLITNTLGMYIGSKIVEYCDLERYQWRQLITPTVRSVPSPSNPQGRIKLFRPKMVRFRNMVLIAIMVVLTMLGELNTFYIKFILWTPPAHWFNCLRVLINLTGSVPAAHEFYFECLGRKRRIIPYLFCVGIVLINTMELVAYMRLGYDQFKLILPQHIVILWLGIIMMLCAYTLWRLVLRKIFMGPEEDEEEGERHHGRMQQRLKHKQG